MNSLTLYIVSLVGIVMATGGYAIHKYGFAHFKTEQGKQDLKGILKGIALAILFGILVAGVGSLSGCTSQGKWFNSASVYTGLDYTKDVSPMCENGNGQFDNQATSNLGLRGNIYQQDQFSANAKYTHHSCAYGIDDQGYDAFGVELQYQFWSRK